MNRHRIILTLFCFTFLFTYSYAGFFGDIGGSVFGGLGQTIGNMIDGGISAITSFVGGAVNSVSSAVGAIFGNTPTPSTSSNPSNIPSPNTSPSNGGWKEIPQPNTQPSGGGNYTPTYEYQYDSYTHTIKEEHSQLELTGIYHKTIIKQNKVFPNSWLYLYSEITNVGADAGTTEFNLKMDCRNFNDVVGSSISNYKTEIDTGWIKTSVLKGGATRSFNNQWRVPKTQYQYGGDCQVHAQLRNNIKRVTSQQNIFCTIITTFLNGSSFQKKVCNNGDVTKVETVETGGNNTKDYSFKIEPNIPKLGGTANIGMIE